MNVNRVFLSGVIRRIGMLLYADDGRPSLVVTLATTESLPGAQPHEWTDRTECHRLQFSGDTADRIQREAEVGQELSVEGPWRSRMEQECGVEYPLSFVDVQSFQLGARPRMRLQPPVRNPDAPRIADARSRRQERQQQRAQDAAVVPPQRGGRLPRCLRQAAMRQQGATP